ncbi:MAG: ABC transporter permease [Thermoleophilia bacterium]|nr:ABC transporter permease [Thermoleophilia bacterium]
MLRFIIRRLLWTIPVILITTFGTFLLVRQLPPPFKGNVKLPPQVKANLLHLFGLDKPWYQQYSDYMVRLVHGNFGLSTKAGNPNVVDIIRDTLPVSMLLGGSAFVVAMVVGITLGVLSALWANRPIDWIITIITTTAFAIPTFLVCQYSVELLPYWSIGWNTLQSKIMPILVLGFSIMPYFTRVVRATVLETLQSDFIQTARAKGLPWRTTVIRHVVRNSLIPTVTNAGPLLGFILTGSFLIESIMNVPGVAGEFVRSFGDPLDPNMILDTTVLVSVMIILANLLVDISVAWLDPRITND